MSTPSRRWRNGGGSTPSRRWRNGGGEAPPPPPPPPPSRSWRSGGVSTPSRRWRNGGGSTRGGEAPPPQPEMEDRGWEHPQPEVEERGVGAPPAGGGGTGVGEHPQPEVEERGGSTPSRRWNWSLWCRGAAGIARHCSSFLSSSYSLLLIFRIILLSSIIDIACASICFCLLLTFINFSSSIFFIWESLCMSLSTSALSRSLERRLEKMTREVKAVEDKVRSGRKWRRRKRK